MCCETFNQTLKMILFFFINDDPTNPVPTVILTNSPIIRDILF